MTFLSITSPWFANDALEYAIVARELLHNNDILTYPVISAEGSTSGFFGPMTHPPLYPSLLYLFQAGANSDMIGWPSKLVTLWFCIGACALIYTIGRLHSEETGAISALLFLSIPLLRDSVATGLIDILPLTGLMLIVASQIGIAGSPAYRGVISGFCLGCALWTHSQAILFPPVFIVLTTISSGFKIKDFLTASSVGIGVAAVISAFPYLRNLMIFGSAVSDNPAIFALPSLQWNEYFTITRGLSNITSRIQYGLLKGWFSIASFGIFFWTAIPGIFATLFLIARHRPHQLDPQTENTPLRIARVMIATLATYYAGVAVSTMLGIDLLIRNDRYLLAWIGPIAIISGIGLSFLFRAGHDRSNDTSQSAPKREIAAVSTTTLILATLIAPTAASSIIQLYQSIHPLREGSHFYDLLDQLDNIRLAKDIDGTTEPNAVILGTRPGDLYYQTRRMISYLDPRMTPVYLADTVDEASKRLGEIGITHIQQPNYFMPTTYRTKLESLLADPSRSKLIRDHNLNQLYELGDSGKIVGDIVDLTGSATAWEYAQSIQILESSRFRIESNAQRYVVGTPSNGIVPLGLFEKNFTTVLKSRQRVHLNKAAEYRLEAEISGASQVRVTISFCSKELRLTEIVLERPNTHTIVQRRFISPIEADEFELRIEHVGVSNATLHRATLINLTDRQ